MATNVVRFAHRGENRWGVVHDGSVRAVVGDYPTTGAFITGAASAVRAGTHALDAPQPLAELDVRCPITTDQQFLCQAINYRTHLTESGFKPESSPYNVFFRKASSCLAPADTEIISPPHVEFLDYEVEIGLVLAKDVDAPVEVTDVTLADHVAALVALNDVSARDVQLADGQFYKAKSYRTFGPAGPFLTLVSGTDLDRFDQLRLRLWVNDEIRQDEYASGMVHKPGASLSELSSVQDWRAGDVLATGTPGGCALKAPPVPIRLIAQLLSPKRRHGLVQRSAARNERCLSPGHRVELHIGTDDGAIDLGRQRTPVIAG